MKSNRSSYFIEFRMRVTSEAFSQVASMSCGLPSRAVRVCEDRRLHRQWEDGCRTVGMVLSGSIVREAHWRRAQGPTIIEWAFSRGPIPGRAVLCLSMGISKTVISEAPKASSCCLFLLSFSKGAEGQWSGFRSFAKTDCATESGGGDRLGDGPVRENHHGKVPARGQCSPGGWLAGRLRFPDRIIPRPSLCIVPNAQHGAHKVSKSQGRSRR